MKTVSLLNQTKQTAWKWTAGIALVTVVLSAGLFALLFFQDSERGILSLANSSISSYRSDILSGDVRSVELQLNREFKNDSSEKFIFLDSTKIPWVGDLREQSLNTCDNANGVCRDLLNAKLILDLPIYFDSEKKILWGYLHVEKKPNVHWSIIFYVSLTILLGMLLLAFGLYFQFLKSVKLVSTTMETWATHLSKDPKDSTLFANVPFEEIQPIALSLAGLNKEITLLEKSAREQGSLNTLRSIGHDILNPVSRIKRMLGLLQIHASTSPAYDAETFSNLNANLKRLSGYAEQIKSLYKKNTGENSSTLSPIDISRELLAIANEVSQDADAINKKIAFEMDLSPNCYVNVPSPIVGRIAENLLLNSFHASSDKSLVKVRSFATNEYVHFVIEDNGAGIADEIKSKVFDPDFTTKINKGTGLGLFVVKQLCEEYKGNIKFSSRLGVGTTFEVAFPKAEVFL